MNAEPIAFHLIDFDIFSKLSLIPSKVPVTLSSILKVLNNIAKPKILFAKFIIVGRSTFSDPTINVIIAFMTSPNFLNPALIVSPYLR